MGFNIAGLVINKNYQRDIKRLGDDLKWGIEIVEEVDFETASSNWTPEGEFRLHFTDKATLVFFTHEWVAEQYHSETAKTLNYAYSATSMAFQVDLFESGKLVRSIMEYEGEQQFAQGSPLEIEEENPTADELTFALIDELLGEKFDSIDLSEKSFICKKTRYAGPSEQERAKQIDNAVLSGSPALQKDEMHKNQSAQKRNSSNAPFKPKKKWWEIWK